MTSAATNTSQFPSDAELMSRPLGGRSLAGATWALFVGLAILFLGGGLFASIVGVRVEQLDFGQLMVALVVAAYYGGFLAGSSFAAGALSRVGHVRVFGALTSALTASVLVVATIEVPAAWVVSRFVAGFCLAGLFVTAESWLNLLASRSNRQRLLAIYSVIGYGVWGIGQGLVGPAGTGFTAFAVAAICISLATIPIALSESATGLPIGDQPKLSWRELARIAPTGVGWTPLIGIANSVLIGLGVIWATRRGLDADRAGWLIAAASVGVVVLEWPLAWLSDRIDRRIVGAATATVTVIATAAMFAVDLNSWAAIVIMGVIGGTSFPLYSFALAATYDFVDSRHAASAGSKLVLLYGLGAFIGPLVGSATMAVVGTDGYLWALIATHVAIIMFLAYRLATWHDSQLLHPEGADSTVPPAPYRVFMQRATVILRRRPRRR